MKIFELIHHLMDAGLLDGLPCGLLGSEGTCPGSTFNVITAAFATQGYWMQADLLYYFTAGMGTFAILVYLLGAIGGIFSMAMGQPPKAYMWYFIGPGIFHFLMETTVPVQGVQVMVGPQDTIASFTQIFSSSQRKVWELAETGLRNTNIFQREGYEMSTIAGPIGGSNGNGTVDVAWAFVWFDTIVSDLVQNMVDWTGAFRIAGTTGGLSNLFDLNPAEEKAPHHLVRDLKWQVLEDITAAKLSSPDLRDTFVTFLQSECGDELAKSINAANFAAIVNSKGTNLPLSIFTSYSDLATKMAGKNIPTPRSLLRALKGADRYTPGSFPNSLAYFKSQEFTRDIGTNIGCEKLLMVIVNAFRWESGHIYYQTIAQAPPGMKPSTFVYDLFYGWPIRKEESLLDQILSGVGLGNIAQVLDPLGPEEQANFLKDLILVHLFRNEFTLAPQPVTAAKSASNEGINYSETFQSTVGQKAKFSEVYTWALMMPYLQGVLLYVLAMAYPFVCVMILIPGWHKIIWTWASFWAWAKLWDLGFAIITVLERSVWSIIGNNSDAIRQFGKVLGMQKLGTVSVTCANTGRSVVNSLCGDISSIPIVKVGNGTLGATYGLDFESLAKILDRAMTLGANMDLDLANSYYIYIMAALYFAVPAVTGQLVLGAKAGAAGMVQNMFGGMAGEVGKASGTGYSGDVTARLGTNAAAARQASYAKALRSGDAHDAAINALKSGNRALEGEMRASAVSAASQGVARISRAAGLSVEQNQAALTAGLSRMGAEIAAQQGDDAVGIARAKELAGLANAGDTAAQMRQGVHTGRANQGTASAGTGTGTGTGNLPLSPAQQADRAKHAGRANAWEKGRAIAGAGTGAATSLATGAYEVDSARYGVASRYLDSVGAAGSLNYTNDNKGFQAYMESVQQGMEVDGFGLNNYARGDRDAASKQGRLADFQAQESSWFSMNDYASQLGGTVRAMGVESNPVQAGSKPQEMESMAMLGDLGGQAKGLSLYTTGGRNSAYGQQVQSQATYLDTNWGAKSTLDQYQPLTSDQAVRGYKDANGNDVMGAYQYHESTRPIDPTTNQPYAKLKSDEFRAYFTDGSLSSSQRGDLAPRRGADLEKQVTGGARASQHRAAPPTSPYTWKKASAFE